MCVCVHNVYYEMVQVRLASHMAKLKGDKNGLLDYHYQCIGYLIRNPVGVQATAANCMSWKKVYKVL